MKYTFTKDDDKTIGLKIESNNGNLISQQYLAPVLAANCTDNVITIFETIENRGIKTIDLSEDTISVNGTSYTDAKAVTIALNSFIGNFTKGGGTPSPTPSATIYAVADSVANLPADNVPAGAIGYAFLNNAVEKYTATQVVDNGVPVVDNGKAVITWEDGGAVSINVGDYVKTSSDGKEWELKKDSDDILFWEDIFILIDKTNYKFTP
ncbi:MAG: hypothetical protein LBM67_08480, partial [Lentimicrobiaceae bacterium]|nr:hypothetical protein [Lentimicrobiaceae bacterium]